MADIFDPGDRVRLTRTFTSIGGAAIITVDITATVEDPAGVPVSPALDVTVDLASPSVTGTAFLTIPAVNTAAGWWRVRWVASGDIVAADEAEFYVTRSAVLA